MISKWLTTVISMALTMVFTISLIAYTPVTGAVLANSNGEFIDEPNSKLSPELEPLVNNSDPASDEPVRVIVQTRQGIQEASNSLINNGGRIKRSLPLVGGYVAEMPRSALAAVASEEDTLYISINRETMLLQNGYDFNLLRKTTGVSNVLGYNGLDRNRGEREVKDHLRSLPPGPNGDGVTIAVLDSGIYDAGTVHEDLRVINEPSRTRVVARQNFVCSEQVSADDLRRGFDPYGHGTHVAGIAAGSGRESLQDAAAVGNFYGGVAFNSDVVDLRVIGVDGTGYISDTIAAIDWMIRNRVRYNIRVANFSIGAGVTQSYRRDPLCQAVERAVSAGIVCVVAAGNYGRDTDGQTIYGGILAPANDPFVITVGATNTQGSARRSDDAIASYSSRGPTLVDYVAKPDLVAPGTLIRSVAANRNILTVNNNLTVYSREGQDVYMWLSGTSMAAPVVAGTVALMLNANPSLTPAMVKSILQFTAQPLPSLANVNPLMSMLNQGAGYMNADGAVRLAEAFDSNVRTAGAGAQLLRRDPVALNRLLYSSQTNTGEFTSNIAGEIIRWGDNIFFSHGLAYFYDNSYRLGIYNTAGWQASPGFNLLQGYLTTDGRLISDGRLSTDGRIITDGRLIINGRIVTDARLLTDGWLYDTNQGGFTNTSAVQPIWSSNLIDQGMLGSGVFNQRAASEQIMVLGDEAPGITIKRIESRKHPLFPRRTRNRN